MAAGDIFWLIVVGVAAGAIWSLLFRIFSRKKLRSQKDTTAEMRCSACGYVMAGLPMPRCPECGALRGFKVSVDQLGLSEQELREGFARRREQRAPPDAPE